MLHRSQEAHANISQSFNPEHDFGVKAPHMNSTVELELFGVDKSAQYQSVRQQLISALDKTGINYQVQDIGDISKFIEIGLYSVPAIRVDKETLFSIPEGNDAKTTISSVINFIVEHKLKSLLVPVDFSSNSENAVHYAMKLAEHLHLGLELMHVYHPVVDPHNAIVLDGEMGNIMKEQLDTLTERISKEQTEDKSINIRARFEIGFPVQMISEASHEQSTSMLIMGTLGATNVVDQVLGSNSSSVATKAGKPVLLVPPGVEFKPIKHIVVAFTEELLESKAAFENLINFNEPFNAHIDFVHFGDINVDSFQSIRDKLVQRIFSLGTPQFSFDAHEVSKGEGSIADDIQEYSDEHKPDLLVVVAQQRSFIKGLFHASVTRKICLNPHGPILVLHKT